MCVSLLDVTKTLISAPKVGNLSYITIMLPSAAAKGFNRNLSRHFIEIRHFHSLCFGRPRILRQDPHSESRKEAWRCVYASVYLYGNNASKDGSKSPGATQTALKKAENVRTDTEKVVKPTSDQQYTDPEFDVLEVLKEENMSKPNHNLKTIEKNGIGDIFVRTEFDGKNNDVTKVTIEKKNSESGNGLPRPVKKRLLIDYSASYTERNFITPMRAMTEYLLKQSDLESLPKVLRRSPYESEPPMTVHYRRDVEAKAIAVWGTKEILEKELLRRELDRRRYEQVVNNGQKKTVSNTWYLPTTRSLSPIPGPSNIKPTYSVDPPTNHLPSPTVNKFRKCSARYGLVWEWRAHASSNSASCLNVFTVKRRLRNYRREMSSKRLQGVEETGLRTISGRVVLAAIGINGCNFLFKLCAWCYTGSHSLFSECIHSFADTVNQLILAYGIHKSGQIANPDHPYGYTNMRYVSSLISGVGIFCVGSGLSFYHGVSGILHPQPLHDFFWAYFVLGGAVVSEGATLLIALSAIRKGAKEANVSIFDYIMRSSDPSVNVVLLEDSAAVAGVIVAASCMAISQYTGHPLPDAIGSILVGTILGGVASFIILSNVGALIGRSIPQEKLDEINSFLERDFMIRAIHDVKGIDIGSNLIRYKAEVDFDGRALTKSYIEKHDLNNLLEDIKKIVTIDDVESFLLKHGENIVDMLGGEIDRIELKLRKKFPQIRHCDLEIL